MGVVWIFFRSYTPLFSHSEMPVGQTHLYKQIKPAWLNWAISLESSTLMGDDRLKYPIQAQRVLKKVLYREALPQGPDLTLFYYNISTMSFHQIKGPEKVQNIRP